MDYFYSQMCSTFDAHCSDDLVINTFLWEFFLVKQPGVAAYQYTHNARKYPYDTAQYINKLYITDITLYLSMHSNTKTFTTDQRIVF